MGSESHSTIVWSCCSWWRRQWRRTPALFPGKSHGRRSLVGCSPWGPWESGHDWVTSFSLSCIGEGNGNPLQCSCLENPGDSGAWWAAVCGVAQSRTRPERRSSRGCCSRCLLILWGRCGQLRGALGQEMPRSRSWQPTPLFLPGEPRGPRRSLAGSERVGQDSEQEHTVDAGLESHPARRGLWAWLSLAVLLADSHPPSPAWMLCPRSQAVYIWHFHSVVCILPAVLARSAVSPALFRVYSWASACVSRGPWAMTTLCQGTEKGVWFANTMFIMAIECIFFLLLLIVLLAKETTKPLSFYSQNMVKDNFCRLTRNVAEFGCTILKWEKEDSKWIF